MGSWLPELGSLQEAGTRALLGICPQEGQSWAGRMLRLLPWGFNPTPRPPAPEPALAFPSGTQQDETRPLNSSVYCDLGHFPRGLSALKNHKLPCEHALGAATPSAPGMERIMSPPCLPPITTQPPSPRPPGRGRGRWARRVSHLQVLLLPGEGIGEPLGGLGPVLRHLGLDGVRDLLEHRVDLFQEAPRLVDVIQLQTGRKGCACHVPSPGPGGLCRAGQGTTPPLGDGPAWEQGAGWARMLPPTPGFPAGPESSGFRELPAKRAITVHSKALPQTSLLFKKR